MCESIQGTSERRAWAWSVVVGNALAGGQRVRGAGGYWRKKKGWWLLQPTALLLGSLWDSDSQLSSFLRPCTFVLWDIALRMSGSLVTAVARGTVFHEYRTASCELCRVLGVGLVHPTPLLSCVHCHRMVVAGISRIEAHVAHRFAAREAEDQTLRARDRSDI